ncbi:unnamed protein product [Aureobasidium pullulans]|nr:unnamed protein product [Aureobasidium pullulans]
MPTFKELKAQGLSDHYPLIMRNDQEELYRELPAPTFLTLATSGNTTLGDMSSFSQYHTDKQDLDEHGRYPPRPDNLPPRPVRDTSDHVLEKRFGRLVPIKRPLNDEEHLWRDHDYLTRYTRWKCSASRMPVEWCLLEPAEYVAYDSLNPIITSLPVATTTFQETHLGIFFLLLLSIGVLVGNLAGPRTAMACFIAFYVLLLPSLRLQQNLVNEIYSSVWAAVSTPATTLGVMVCWITGTIGLAVATLVTILATRILDPLVSLTGQFRNGDSTFWHAIYSVQLAATEMRDGLLSEVTSAYEARFTLIFGSVLCSGSIYLMLEEPSTTWLCTCIALCLVMVVCILAAFMAPEDHTPATDGNPVLTPVAATIIPPVANPSPYAATTIYGRSGVVFAKPLATPPSFSKSTLSEGTRPRELVHDFGTPTRGPLGKDFGARPDAISRVDVGASVQNAIDNLSKPEANRFIFPPLRSSTAPPASIRRQPSFISIKSTRSLPLRAFSTRLGRLSRAGGSSSRGAGFIYEKNDSSPSTTSPSKRKQLALSILVKDLPTERPSSILMTPTNFYQQGSLSLRRSTRNNQRRSMGSDGSPKSGQPSPGILEVIPEDSGAVAHRVPSSASTISPKSSPEAPALPEAIASEIHLSSGTVLMVKTPETTAYRRSIYIQGPIKLPTPAVVPRKGSIATLDPFQDSLANAPIPRRKSEDMAADDICDWYDTWGFDSVSFALDEFTLDETDLTKDWALSPLEEEPESPVDRTVRFPSPAPPLAKEVAAAMMGNGVMRPESQAIKPRPLRMSMPMVPRNSSGETSYKSAFSDPITRTDSRGSGMSNISSVEEKSWFDTDKSKRRGSGSAEPVKPKPKMSRMRRFVQTASAIL